MYDSKDKTVALSLWKSKFKFAPHNLLLAAILNFGEAWKVAYIL